MGKSALVQMFHSKGTHFPKQYQMTTGCDFVMKEIKLPESGSIVELHIYDCAGQVQNMARYLMRLRCHTCFDTI